MPIDLPTDHFSYVTTAYQRYGGMMQTSPLTADEQKYDDTCREIDQLKTEIGAKSMALFTAKEFMLFSGLMNKMHFFPKQPQLDRQLENLKSLLADLEQRKMSK